MKRTLNTAVKISALILAFAMLFALTSCRIISFTPDSGNNNPGSSDNIPTPGGDNNPGGETPSPTPGDDEEEEPAVISPCSEHSYQNNVCSVCGASHWTGAADTSWYSAAKTSFEISTAEQLAGMAELSLLGVSFEGATLTLTHILIFPGTPGSP